MNPFDIWYKQNELLQKALHQIYETNINNVDSKLLKENITYIFHQGVQGKFSAVTALLAYNLHFKH